MASVDVERRWKNYIVMHPLFRGKGENYYFASNQQGVEKVFIPSFSVFVIQKIHPYAPQKFYPIVKGMEEENIFDIVVRNLI